ncbi:DUF1592 domain-containing protein [Bremerella sp. JC817]
MNLLRCRANHLSGKVLLWAASWLFISPVCVAAEEARYVEEVRPLLQKYCFDCHAGDTTEAEIDLGRFNTFEQLPQDQKTWIKTRRMLDEGQMPPKDSNQPSETEAVLLRTWVHNFLKEEAKATAGDPGPVVLRRLNNDEYNFTVRDLTGVASLDPTREFPVDGAAGEGFINTGAAQAMSPAMVSKYLDAAKEVASHAVLVPEGIEFSAGASRRDWSDERVAAVRQFYQRFTTEKDVYVEVGGTGKVANEGGAIPFGDYLAATIVHRETLARGEKSLAAIAEETGLNAKYLAILWEQLQKPDDSSSLYLNELRRRWQTATSDDVPALMNFIESLQQRMWKFNSIGQLTEGARQKIWMSPVSTVVTSQEIRVPLKAQGESDPVSVYFHANDLRTGRGNTDVVWQRPQLQFRDDKGSETHPPVLLKDVEQISALLPKLQQSELPRTDQYLAAVAELHRTAKPLGEVASSRQLNERLLASWAKTVGLGVQANREVTGHFTNKLENVAGYDEVNGWGGPQTPSIVTNRSAEVIQYSTLSVPAGSVVVHPSPTQQVVISWRSPAETTVQLTGMVADVDPNCGNGVAWQLNWISAAGEQVLASGAVDNGSSAKFDLPEQHRVQAGDVIEYVINARDKSHVCDSTQIELTISEMVEAKRNWSLSRDIVEPILQANPLPDQYGHDATWHLGVADAASQPVPTAIIPESALATWKDAIIGEASTEAVANATARVQAIVTQANAEELASADQVLRRQVIDWRGPLRWMEVALSQPTAEVAVTSAFGKHPRGKVIAAEDLCVAAPAATEISLPASLLDGAELVVVARLDEATSAEGAAQVSVTLQNEASPVFDPNASVLVSPGSQGKQRIDQAAQEFRELFPPVVCYSRIVPVDEVVTMTLYFREDEALQRLMLNAEQVGELDRLWDHLRYVAQEPIALTVVYEQIYEFATQDRQDLVNAFEPMRTPIFERADAFRARLIETEPSHLEAVIRFADRAWRRPLSSSEQQRLRGFYRQLRAAEIEHDEAIRLTLARVLTSPAYLYRYEQPGEGDQAVPVTSAELATRLSFFLWSSIPDATLRQAADTDTLTSETDLLAQTQRMLDAPKVRRLATQFACQWLHVRDFDRNDDKNEQLYPEFQSLRVDMNEETVRFFEDMFRNNRSVLDILDADHTFLNEALAKHYGIDGVTGPEWRKVEGIRQHGRGGVFGLGTVLASQSGASRTSPILRGNWTYETLLGQQLPRPPANVPQLPDQLPEGLTARQLIEKHSSDAACAKCHQKIDPYGFALEQYDAIGRRRSEAVDTRSTLESGHKIEGVEGLRRYLLTQRQDDVVRQFCRKLLGFALGREVMLSDEILLDQMQSRLAENDYRFHAAVEAIVLSPQFRSIRGRDWPTSQEGH